MTLSTTRPASRPNAGRRARPAAGRRPRRGVILLFVVVLLTLLAIVGSAFLISTRIDANQVGPEARGKEVDVFGIDAKERVEDVRAAAVQAAQLQLFLDLFESRREPIGVGGTAERAWPVGTNTFMLWRPTRSSADAVMPRTAGTAPMPNPDLTVPAGMADFANLAYYAADAGGVTGNQFFNSVLDDADGDNTDNSNDASELLFRRFPYYPIDALGGTDPHLAAARVEWENSLQDPRLPAAELGEYVWRWVSGPLVGLPGMSIDNVFVNPFGDSTTNVPVPIRNIVNHPTVPSSVVAVDLDVFPAGRANVVPTVYRPYFYNGFDTGSEPAAVNYGPDDDVLAFGGTDAEFYNDRSRVFPGFEIDADNDGALDYKFPAADADGDGVADSGLVPIVFQPNIRFDNPNRYFDSVTGYAYTVSTRIVDNNASVNLNTALSVTADYKLFDATGVDVPLVPATVNWETAFIDTTGAQAAPNRGYWPSNIGLYELFPVRTGGLPATSNVGDTAGTIFNTLIPTLLGKASATDPLTVIDAVLPGQYGRTDATVATLGESLGIGVAGQLVPDAPVAVGFDSGGAIAPAPFLGEDVETALRFNGGGWLVPQADTNRLERAAEDALVIQAGNFAPLDDAIATAFPLYDPANNASNLRQRRNLWAKLFQTADPELDTAAPLDEPGFGLAFTYDRATLLGGGGTDRYPISPRAGLVSRNGVSGAFSPAVLNPRQSAFSLSQGRLPPGMSPYAGASADSRPPVQAGLNTAGFGELYRAAWNIMNGRAGVGSPDNMPLAPVVPTTANPGIEPLSFAAPVASTGVVPGDDEFDPTDIDVPDLTREQVLLLRSALWAVNLMDVRDIENAPGGIADPGDSDITVAEIPLSFLRNSDVTADYQPNPTAADFNEYLPYDTNDPNGDGTAWAAGTPPVAKQLFARVYGAEAQPYITEVIAQWDAAGTSLEYLAVELLNPYPYDLQMRGWRLVARDVNTGALTDLATLGEPGDIAPVDGVTDVQVFPGAVTDPAATPTDPTDDVYAPHRFVLEFGTRPATDFTYPAASDATVTRTEELADGTDAQSNGNLVAGETTFTPAGLAEFDTNDHVLMLMRPALANADAAPAPADPLYAQLYPQSARADYNLVPLDAVDFRGIAGASGRRIRYSRNDADRQWQFVFAGETDEANATVQDTVAVSEGMVALDALLPPAVPGTPAYDGELGVVNTVVTVDAANAGVTATGGFPVGPVLGGPIYETGSTVPVFPYGGFARDGDGMAVPFVGGYTLFLDGAVLNPGQSYSDLPPAAQADGLQADTEIVAIRPLTVDTAFADVDGNDFWGRFIPVNAAGGAPVHAWADDVLDYVTATANYGSDTFPNADLRYTRADASLNVTSRLPTAFLTSYAPAVGRLFTVTSPPYVVPPIDTDGDGEPGLLFPSDDFAIAGFATATDALAARMREAFVPAQGRLNALTADAGVLKLSPLDVTATGFNEPAATSAAALLLANVSNATPMATVTFRQPVNVSGTTNAITGLSAFRYDTKLPNADGSLPGSGDVTGRMQVGMNPNADVDFVDVVDGTATDYELAITDVARVSNLLTTRSDSYTVYILVQAWEDFGSSQARVVRQERVAFTVDRSGVYPTGNGLGLPGDAGYATPADAIDALKITPVPVK